MSTAQEQPPLVERIERALLLLAYFIELDGDVHVPMYEKFEAELEELKKKEDTKDRARRLLLSYSRSGDCKVISSKNLNFNSGSRPLDEMAGANLHSSPTVVTETPP